MNGHAHLSIGQTQCMESAWRHNWTLFSIPGGRPGLPAQSNPNLPSASWGTHDYMTTTDLNPKLKRSLQESLGKMLFSLTLSVWFLFYVNVSIVLICLKKQFRVNYVFFYIWTGNSAICGETCSWEFCFWLSWISVTDVTWHQFEPVLNS